jgi:hypothetical protein
MRRSAFPGRQEPRPGDVTIADRKTAMHSRLEIFKCLFSKGVRRNSNSGFAIRKAVTLQAAGGQVNDMRRVMTREKAKDPARMPGTAGRPAVRKARPTASRTRRALRLPGKPFLRPVNRPSVRAAGRRVVTLGGGAGAGRLSRAGHSANRENIFRVLISCDISLHSS